MLWTNTKTVLGPHLAHFDNLVPRRGQGMRQALLKGVSSLPQDNPSLPGRFSAALAANLASCHAYRDHPSLNELALASILFMKLWIQARGWFKAAPMLAALSASSLICNHGHQRAHERVPPQWRASGLAGF